MSVLFISAELEEVLRLSHRVVVLRDRHVVADLENDGLTVDSLLALIADGSVEAEDIIATDAAAALAAAGASATDSTTDHTAGGPR
jgi:monosaccharide-transporting ATPase